MSVVIAIRDQARIYIGSDSLCTTAGHEKWHGMEKIWKHQSNPNVMIAGTGSDWQVINYARHHWPFLEATPDHESVYKWLTSLRGNIEFKDVFNFMIVGNGKMFVAGSDYFIIEQKEYCAIGDGREVAMGALYATQLLDMDVETRIRLAFEATQKYNNTVGGELKIFLA